MKLSTVPLVFGLVLATLTAQQSTVDAAICDVSPFNCPVSGTCVISGTWNVADGCLLNFGPTRAVELRGTLQADQSGGSFSIVGGTLALVAGKLRSVASSTVAGGDIDVELVGSFTMSGSGPRIDVSGNAGGGTVTIHAGSGMSLATGVVDTSGGIGIDCGDAGNVDLTSDAGAVYSAVPINAYSGGHDCVGGSINVSGTNVTIEGTLDARGGAEASTEAIFLDATAGHVWVLGSASLKADGTGQDEGVGASGGNIGIVARAGGIVLSGPVVSAGASAPDGQAGSIWISASGDVEISSDLMAKGESSGVGGGIFLEAGETLALTGDVIATGGFSFPLGAGGGVDLYAKEALLLDGSVDASGAYAGRVFVQTGQGQTLSSGVVDIGGELVARGNRGVGGYIGVRACDVDLTGTLDAGSSNGGEAGLVDIFGDQISIATTAQAKAAPCGAGDTCSEVNGHVGEVSIAATATLDPIPNVITRPLSACSLQ